MTKFALLLLIYSGVAFSSRHHVIDTLGASPKGQFVALEEYGHRSETNAYFVSIKVMNVWKKEYVEENVEIELPAHNSDHLEKARKKARKLAQEFLSKYKISSS